MENGSFLNKDYFEKLLEEIREIRLIEKILSFDREDSIKKSPIYIQLVSTQ